MFLVHSQCDVNVWLKKKTYLNIFVVLADVGRLEFTLTAKVSQNSWEKPVAQMDFVSHMTQYHNEETRGSSCAHK